MNKSLGEADSMGGWHYALRVLTLLWLAGAMLRMTVLAIPPLIPALHRDLGLGETGIAIVTSLPSFMFAWAAAPGALLISRAGLLRTLIGGLTLTAIAGALRGAATGALTIYTATIFMCLGISLMQPTLPPLVRQWMPSRVGFGTAVYSNGWLIGEILSVWLTVPFVVDMFGGSWRWSLAFWSIPPLVTALCFGLGAPRESKNGPGVAPRRWLPPLNRGMVWRLGAIMAGANATYWAPNAFLPDLLTHIGKPELISHALTALNVGQLPVSFILLLTVDKLAGKAWPMVGLGVCVLLGLAGMVSTDSTLILTGAALDGFACAGALILSLTVPPMVCASEDVPRVTAGMFFLSYNCSVIVPIVGGAIWDATHSPYPAFGLIALSAVPMLVMPLIGLARGLERPAA